MPIGISIEDYRFTEEALNERPEHAATLGRIFTSWSLIEATVGGTLGHLMDAPAHAAIALLSTYRTNSSRVNAVRKVAKATLPDTEVPDFETLMKSVLKYAERRNEIAHGLWGVKEGEPDNVYRLPLTALTDFMVKQVQMVKAGKVQELVDEFQALMETYSLADLRALEAEGAEVLKAVMTDHSVRAATKHGRIVRPD